MEGINFIEDLAAVMLAAGIFGSLCKRIGLSVIVGYLVAGIVLGPYTPPFAFVHDLDRIHTLSQLGLVFLMFSIGLELSLNKLRKLGPSMAVATALGAFLAFNFTQALGSFAGWPRIQTLFTAAMLMVSSSAVIARPLRALRIPQRTGAVVVGVERDGRKQPNPSGDEIVTGGEQWLVIGAAEELRLLKVLLAGPSRGVAPAAP